MKSAGLLPFSQITLVSWRKHSLSSKLCHRHSTALLLGVWLCSFGLFIFTPQTLQNVSCTVDILLNEEAGGRDKPGCSSLSGHLEFIDHCLLESGSVRLLPPSFHFSYYECAQFQLNLLKMSKKWVIKATKYRSLKENEA